MSTENDRSQQYWKEPPQETSYEAHLRRKRLKRQQKARSTKSQLPSEEQDSIEAREDAGIQDQTNWPQRATIKAIKPHPSASSHPRPYGSSDTGLPEDYSRENYETEPPSAPSTRHTRLPEDYHEDDYEIETDLPRELPKQRTRSIDDRNQRRGRIIDPTADTDQRRGRFIVPTASAERSEARINTSARNRAPSVRDRRTTGKTTRHLPEARRRRAWPWLLVGCAGGILTIALIVAIVLVIFFRTSLGGALFGGIFNQTFTQKNLQTFKISNFSLIQLNNKVGGVTSNVTIIVDPTASETTLTTVKKVQAGNSSDANKEFARIPLILSPVNAATPTLILTICSQGNTACGGNIGDSVNVTITLPTSTNANGSYLFDIETRVGTISVQQAQLAAGSCLSTGSGNVTFKGSFDTTNSSDLNPCGQPTSNAHPWYKIHSEVGNLDITPFPTIKNVLLDASTTAGKINSDGFNLNIVTSNGSENYHGPLIAPAAQPTAELVLDVGTGDITLHKL